MEVHGNVNYMKLLVMLTSEYGVVRYSGVPASVGKLLFE